MSGPTAYWTTGGDQWGEASDWVIEGDAMTYEWGTDQIALLAEMTPDEVAAADVADNRIALTVDQAAGTLWEECWLVVDGVDYGWTDSYTLGVGGQPVETPPADAEAETPEDEQLIAGVEQIAAAIEQYTADTTEPPNDVDIGGDLAPYIADKDWPLDPYSGAPLSQGSGEDGTFFYEVPAEFRHDETGYFFISVYLSNGQEHIHEMYQ